MSTVAFVIAVVAAIFVMLGIVYSLRVKKVGPNEVLIVSGRGNQARLVTGGRSFVYPVIERVDYLSLELMTIDVRTPDVPSVQGVPVTVDGVAQVKIGSDESSIRTAAIQFLAKSDDEIEHVAHETLAGHLRAILGTLTVEQLYRDREAFAQKVQEVSGEDMANMGMEIVSFVIKDISDDEGYLDALGRPRIAQVKRDATIGEAEAERDATIESAQARQKGESAKYSAQTKIEESRKSFEVQKAVYQVEINRTRAEEENAFPLQQNIESQKVKAEEVQINVIERQKMIEVQEQEALRTEKELEATVRKPAEAKQFEVKTLAEARNFQIKTEAAGEADAIRLRGEAEADALRAKGLAEAEVIRQQGLAEAEATHKKADAWKEYTQAAVLQQLIDQLPQLAEAVAGPLSKTERIVVVGGGGNGEGAGMSKITRDVSDIIAQLPPTVEALTGVDLLQLLQTLPALKNAQQPVQDVPVSDGAGQAPEETAADE